jgi:hypothetical protein
LSSGISPSPNSEGADSPTAGLSKSGRERLPAALIKIKKSHSKIESGKEAGAYFS